VPTFLINAIKLSRVRESFVLKMTGQKTSDQSWRKTFRIIFCCSTFMLPFKLNLSVFMFFGRVSLKVEIPSRNLRILYMILFGISGPKFRLLGKPFFETKNLPNDISFSAHFSRSSDSSLPLPSSKRVKSVRIFVSKNLCDALDILNDS
jgi:hypothetical protein